MARGRLVKEVRELLFLNASANGAEDCDTHALKIIGTNVTRDRLLLSFFLSLGQRDARVD